MTHRAAMLEKLAGLDAEHAKAVAGGGEKYVTRHARGKLLPRERIELLVDPGSAFSSCRRWPAGGRTSRSPAPAGSPPSAAR